MMLVGERLPGASRPIADSTAMTAQVPVPHGDRSTSASAKMVIPEIGVGRGRRAKIVP
jgi:hypothetical protein